MFQGLFVDGFAGGGGASTGIARAIGRDVDIAINHDPMAIAVHKANHPGTEHHCQDIRMVWPTAATRHRPVAGAWFSPDCKEHSKAKGGPVKDRNIRQLPWEIIPWLKDTQPTVGYVENVEEMQMWGPLDEQGHVIKELRGTEFKRWIRAIRALGYRVEWRELRACDYGAPTSRKRLYIVMRRDKLPIRWPKPTHGRPDSPGVRRGRLLPYRTAAECIDWSIPCPSIFDRRRPLKENTERRIAHGVMRYVVNAARPFIVPVTHSKGGGRSHDSVEPLRTVTTANGGEFAAVDATLAPHVTKFRTGSIGSDAGEPMPTVTANGEPARPAGATPLGLVGCTMVQTGHGEREGQAPRALDIDKPLGTVVAGANNFGAVGATLVGVGGRRAQSPPMAVDVPAPTLTSKADGAIVAAAMAPLQNGERRPGEKPREQDIDGPLSTIATGGKHAVVTAHLVNTANGGTTGRGPNTWPAEEPVRTITTSPGFAEVETALAPIIDRQFGRSRGAAADEPLGVTTAGGGGKSAQVSAFLAAHYTSNTNGGRGRPDMPLKTVLAGGQHHSVVAAHMEQANTGRIGHEIAKPVSTITTTGAHQRVVETTLIEEGALPPDLMAKAVRVAAFLVKYYGSAIGAPLDEPVHTVTTLPRYAVVTVTIDAVTYVIVDIGMRMLTPRELARAQGFPEDYILAPVTPKMKRGKLVHEPLTIADQIRMIGNSVCPDVAAALVAANQPGIEMRMAA